MIPAFYAGFCPFRRHGRVVAWLGYGSAVGFYLLDYLLVATALRSALPFGGVVPIAAAATVAAVPTGLYLGWLYGRAVGSPYGNRLLALVTPSLVPWVVYASQFPATTVQWGTWNHPEVVVPAGLAGLVAVLWTVDRAYARLDDPVAWERTVMPHGLRLFGDREADEDEPPGTEDRTTGLAAEHDQLREELGGSPRATPISLLAHVDRESDLGLSMRGWAASLFVVPPAVALALAGQQAYGEDMAFSGIMLLAMLVMIHWSLRVEAPRRETTNRKSADAPEGGSPREE